MVKDTKYSSIARKFLMAISGLFLMVFLLQHLIINFLSVISGDLFNQASHFMGTNPLVQFVLQPLLLFGVLFHLIMGIYLDLMNKKARNNKYIANNNSDDATWMSKNMIITGLMVMSFMVLHFWDFWIPEIKDKFIDGVWDDPSKYFPHLEHKFDDLWRVIVYCVSFVFLSLHLLHGFQSAFQSAGFRHNKYTPTIKKIGNIYAILIPLGFIYIALFHYFS